MTVAREVEDLYAQVRSCQRCSLAQTRRLAVPGEGPLDAEVLFIGEAPGVNEDRQGRPFVGQAGAFPRRTARGRRPHPLRGLHLQRAQVPPAGATAIPCPPRSRRAAATSARRSASSTRCSSSRSGRYSMSRFFPNQSISRIHGRPREANGRILVPMYHPAAALHQQRLRGTIIDDFRTLPELLERARATRSAGAEPAAEEAPAKQIRLFE